MDILGSRNYYMYGFINTKGEQIIETKYYELSNFNEEGYAYGIKEEEYVGERDYKEYDYTYTIFNQLGKFYKIDKTGNEEAINRNEYYKNYNIKPKNKDKILNIKKDVHIKMNIEYILTESIIPFIFVILSILSMKKIIKKDEKNYN